MDDDIKTLAEENGLSFGVLDKAREHARTAAQGKYEGVVTNHKKKYPYESRYGHLWMDVIDASGNMMKWINIHDLVTHMAVETDELMIGTKFQGKGFFKHDAMSLMTAKCSS